MTIAIRPSVGRNGSGYRSDLGGVKTEIFLREGLDTKIAEQPVGQISRPVRRSSVNAARLPSVSIVSAEKRPNEAIVLAQQYGTFNR